MMRPPLAALEMLLEVLASSTSLRDPDGYNAAVTFLRDLQALLAQSAENRETLLSLDVRFRDAERPGTDLTATADAVPAQRVATMARHSALARALAGVLAAAAVAGDANQRGARCRRVGDGSRFAWRSWPARSLVRCFLACASSRLCCLRLQGAKIPWWRVCTPSLAWCTTT